MTSDDINCQWKKETKYYKPLKEKENEVQERKSK